MWVKFWKKKCLHPIVEVFFSDVKSYTVLCQWQVIEKPTARFVIIILILLYKREEIKICFECGPGSIK